MKLLFDFFPIIVFFTVFKFWGIFAATGAAIGATVAQVAFALLRRRKVEKILWINFAIITLFGGATLLLQDETFIKWKPSVLYWAFAATLLVSKTVFNKNIIQGMLEKELSLPQNIWRALNYSWMLFFAVMGAANIFVAYRFPTDTWVNFKLFGLLGLTVLFVIAQGIVLSRHIDISGDNTAEGNVKR